MEEKLISDFMSDLMTRKTGWFETIGESKHAGDIKNRLRILINEIKKHDNSNKT